MGKPRVANDIRRLRFEHDEMTQKQLAGAGAVVGGTMGVVMDTAAGGLTFGVFTAIGGLLGAGSALWSGKKIAHKTAHTIQLGGDRLQVGPNENLQFLYVVSIG